MKAKALSVKECTWMSEECHPVDELLRDTQVDSLCLPNIFKSKKVKPLTRIQSGPTYQVYYTARELLLDVLDRGAVRELIRRAVGVKAGAKRPSYSQSREQSTDLSEEEYAEALTWFSIVLQNGLSAGDNCSFGSELTLKLDGWQGVLKRNSFHTNLLSLTRLEDGDKLEALSAFCSHITRRYQALYTPGQNLAVKKYQLSYQQGPCPLNLALLCDLSSGFVCNMYLYCPEQLQRRSRKPVVAQVVEHLLRPFCSHRHLVQLDSSAWMEGRLTDIFSGFGVNINFVPTVKNRVTDPTSSSCPPVKLHQRRRTSEDSLPQLVAHLQGWTGPALLPLSDLKRSVVDVFLSGFWVALHMICINTFVLHTLQSQSSGRQVHLTEFTRTLASQLAVDSSVTVPVLPRLNSSSYQETSSTNLLKQRANITSCGEAMESERRGCSSAVRLQGWNTPGVCGLNNSGNSCYLNAVLQCLCSTVPLVEHLLNQDTRKELARSKCRVAEAFVRLLEEMWLGRSSSCAPVEARSVLCSILPQFNNYSQQDAQELLLLLLNALHDNLKKVAKQQMRSSIRRPRQDQNRNCAAAAIDSTIVSHLFEGQLSYMTLCMHCKLQGHSTQAFTVLSLPIPTDIIKCSIQDCLSLFFEQTILTGAEQMLCSVCGLRRETAVLTCLDKPPEILMLHLKRFGCKGKNQVKLRTNVAFSMRLDLSPFLSSSVQNTSYSSYRLYAVVNHAGHLNMGHYTALCHNALTQTWHCFDDSVVREVQDSLVQSPNAYLLLYSRKRFQKPKIHGL
ncbi:inactive ubiquitin carboxyl-terminal hydrolase 50 [Seriola lalandi dorsalis]|uniref:inactive ubiquitin carboxyl-terminal hydrolase 50 n=1 Tax=Seriola lalandi dorsalis TaxID=1841481 RepID=UPI000C6F86B5|nr:inactive ubiquitin carboxyl-terminal hydrolase 50 [Seriola lalandi dorsalis]